MSSTMWPGCSTASYGTRCATGTWRSPRRALQRERGGAQPGERQPARDARGRDDPRASGDAVHHRRDLRTPAAGGLRTASGQPFRCELIPKPTRNGPTRGRVGHGGVHGRRRRSALGPGRVGPGPGRRGQSHARRVKPGSGGRAGRPSRLGPPTVRLRDRCGAGRGARTPGAFRLHRRDPA